MTEKETRSLLMKIDSLYPTFNVDNPEEAVKAWHGILKDYPEEDVKELLNKYVKGDKGMYPPNVSNLIPKESYGFKGRVYSHSFYEEIEREVEDSGGVY